MTDPRLDRALARAAEIADAYETAGSASAWVRAAQSVRGWVGAVEALRLVRCHCDEAERIGHNYDCSKPAADKATTKFCDAILGEVKP